MLLSIISSFPFLRRRRREGRILAFSRIYPDQTEEAKNVILEERMNGKIPSRPRKKSIKKSEHKNLGGDEDGG